jgi:hypothetical protein
MPNPDFASLNAGSIILLTPLTPKAADWASRKLIDVATPPAPFQTLEIDHRCFLDIAYGLLEDGLTLQDAATGRVAHRP